MAQKLLLKGTLPFIWNVTNRVGPNFNEPNLQTDVELLNTLCVMFQRHPKVKQFGIKGKSLPISREGIFDTTLAFWIFRMQQIDKQAASDGVVSPARGTSFAPSQPWTIVTFNRYAREAEPEMWANLNRNPFISAALRTELSR
ncbi:hypothetical protein [Bosea sp. 685]|uniref:hypothetical protein n=1 Tax=Bosea sp. 685 TaxID=3080057 RepID=UPI002892F0E1|nr:hypothetical protein [Bosea sp. 685]WNJ92093.1 hypothetical protein RMR04_07290 [Bosea sp. 685]